MFDTVSISGHAMPGVWRYMLPEDFSWIQLPVERLATCGDCPMVALDEYLPECRCCTHFAQIPNFQLGLALKDDRSRELVRQVITRGYTLPEGVEITPAHLLTALKLYDDELFGKSERLLCPFVDDRNGDCGIYPYRNSICATFYCGHDHGHVGARYWERVQDLAGQVETALSQWAMEQTGIDPEAYVRRWDQLACRVETLSGEDPRSWSASARGELWGEWFGREEEFFLACADHAMDHRNELWDIACRRPLQVAYKYELAVKRLIPSENLDDVQTIPDNPGETVPVSDLWYKLQLATRRLWELPYNESPVRLNERVVIEANPKDDPPSRLYGNKPFRVTLPAKEEGEQPLTVFLSRKEHRTLRLFETPQVIGEALLETPEVTALEAPKAFLAECMRCDILVQQDE